VVAEEDYLRLVSLAVGSLVLTPLLMPLGLRWIRSQTETEAWVGKRDPDRVEPAYATVIGAGPIGRQVASRLEISGRDVCLIDLSPINLHGFAVEGFRTIVGDAADPQLLVLAEADRASLQVVCVSNDDVAMRIVRSIRGLNRDSLLVVRCRFQSNRDRLLRLGADRVVSEESVASAALLDILAETL